MWNRYLMLRFVSAHKPWNAISKLELRPSYKALRDDLVLLSATTLSKICRRECALTVDAIKNQLLARNKVSLTLNRWTSPHKLPITTVIAYYMDQNWALREAPLTFDDVDCDQQFVENESMDIGKGQRLRKEGNARINKVSAMKPDVAKIIEKVCISWYFESPEIDLHIAESACCIDYTNTWLSKWVHWQSNSQSSQCCTTDYGCEDTLELNTGVARAHLPITRIHTRMAPKSKITLLPVTFHNSGWMDHCEVCHGSIEAILILDPVNVAEAYSHIASRDHSVQSHVQSHGQRDASFA